jgi:DNA polymerase III delta prime subunit
LHGYALPVMLQTTVALPRMYHDVPTIGWCMSTSLTPELLESALRDALPPEHAARAGMLARALVRAATHPDMPAHLTDPALRPVLHALAGADIAVGRSTVSFDASQLGDVTFHGDIVGRDVVTIALTFTPPPSALTPMERRNRRAMIQKVRAIWVEGLLRRSLADIVRIELGLAERPDAVSMPVHIHIHDPLHPPQSLPPGTEIVDLFDRFGGALLILGAPGAGKTTLLLELCRDLLSRAAQDETSPIPVIFTLSSWAARREPLARWLVEELHTKYDVPRQVAATWVAQDEILPLLDGLDEVSLTHRAVCVGAIDDYRAQHLVSLAVSSRLADYEAMAAKLRLAGAVVVQPLAVEQVVAYLDSGDARLLPLRQALERDTTLRELVTTPLMLHVISLGVVAGQLHIDELGDWRGRVWEAYIAAMVRRRRVPQSRHEPLILHWLRWLARRMIDHQQTVFYIEWIQPSWLPTARQRHIVTWGVALIIIAISSAVGWGLGFFSGGLMRQYGIPAPPGYDMRVVGGALSALIAAICAAIFSYHDEITAMEDVRFSWTGFVHRPWYCILWGLAFGLVVGSPVALVVWAAAGAGPALASGVVVGILLAFVSALALMIIDALGSRPISLRTIPNEGIIRSARNALIMAGIVATVCGPLGVLLGDICVRVVFGAASAPFGRIVGGLYGLIAPTLAMLVWGGGCTVLQHVALRLLLWIQGSAPLHYASVLNAAAERALLRRVGGGYIFIHRLLLEHIAGLSDDRLARLAADREGSLP